MPFIVRKDLGAKDLVTVPGLVLSHSCDVDKYDEVKHRLGSNEKSAWPVTLAPLLSTNQMDEGVLADVRAGRHHRYFHLPHEGTHQELIADLWRIQPVPRMAITRLERVGTISDDYLHRLWAALVVLYTRVDPTTLLKGNSLAS